MIEDSADNWYTEDMMSKGGAIGRVFLEDILGSIIWFPIWWYTTGFQIVLQSAERSIVYRMRSLGLRIWIKNFFVPMYGQNDLVGRLVSIWMRFVVLIGRGIVLVAELILCACGLVLWGIAPFACVLFFMLNLVQFIAQ